MWIVNYILNGKNIEERIDSYELALAKYGVLKSAGKNPSIHWEESAALASEFFNLSENQTNQNNKEKVKGKQK